MKAVYARMISERNQIAEKYTADGNYDASIIRNDVDKQVNIIVSNAKAEAAKLEAEGEAEYMRMLAEAYDTPDKKEFYEFTLALDALKQSLDGGRRPSSWERTRPGANPPESLKPNERFADCTNGLSCREMWRFVPDFPGNPEHSRKNKMKFAVAY